MLFRGLILAALFGAGCDSCHDDPFVDARPIDAPQPGRVNASWALVDLNDQPVLCDQAGTNSRISLALKPRGAGAGAVDLFNCDSPTMASVSRQLPPGSYDASFQLLADQFAPVDAAATEFVTIESGRDTPLTMTAKFKFDARGSIVLSFATPTSTGNCKSKDQGGAGITGMELTVNFEGTCRPTTFTVRRGSVMTGTYTSGCNPPNGGQCFDNNDTLTALSIPSGAYSLGVKAFVNNVLCWQTTGNAPLRVPALGATTTPKVNLDRVSVPTCQ